MKYVSQLRLSDASSTVWVFGAGASAGPPYKVPSQKNLLGRFGTMKRPGGPALQASFSELKTRVEKLCQRVLPGLPFTDERVTLEEIFSANEIALSDLRSSAAERQEAEAAIRDLREAIRLATYVYGRGDAMKWKPFYRNNQASPYAELMEKLFHAGASSSTHRFITFNYDICLDRCIINLRGHPADLDLDYGIALANGRSAAAPTFSTPDPARSVLLLRTHGALNWLRCHACSSVFTTVNRHADVTAFSTCWTCGRDRLDYVLVHPSYLRSYDDPLIRLVWGRCQEELVRAERWVFIGYSLPPADVHFRELLRDCLRQRENAGRPTEVVLVGRGPSSSDEFKTAQESYRVMFEKHLTVWNPTDAGFGDFVGQIVP